MGCPKLMLPFGGRTLLRRAVDTALASECRPIVVVIGAHRDLVRHELHGLPILIADNPDWAQGMSSSLRVAFETLARVSDMDIEGAVIALADQPGVAADDINRLVEVHNHTGKDIVASEYAGTHGVPVFISTRLFAEVAALNGDEGAKRLIARNLEQVATVPLLNAALDIDTPADYERLAPA